MCYRQTSGDEENAEKSVQDFSGKEERGRKKKEQKEERIERKAQRTGEKRHKAGVTQENFLTIVNVNGL